MSFWILYLVALIGNLIFFRQLVKADNWDEVKGEYVMDKEEFKMSLIIITLSIIPFLNFVLALIVGTFYIQEYWKPKLNYGKIISKILLLRKKKVKK